MWPLCYHILRQPGFPWKVRWMVVWGANAAPTGDHLLSAQYPNLLLYAGMESRGPEAQGEERWVCTLVSGGWGWIWQPVEEGGKRPSWIALATALYCRHTMQVWAKLSYNSGCHDGGSCQSDGITQNCMQRLNNDMLSWCPKVQVSWWHV